jgi:flagellar hook-basal body complex protein FliE
MPIAPIPPLPPQPATPSAGSPAPAGGASGSFANQVGNAVDQLQQTQNQASNLEAQAAAGQGNVADAMVAASQASLDTQVTTALTNKAVDAFTDVMNLQF